MVKEAQAHEAEDKKRKELIEAHNQADNLIYQVEKTMRELGEKLPPARARRRGRQNQRPEIGAQQRRRQPHPQGQRNLAAAFYKLSEKATASRRRRDNAAAPPPAGDDVVDGEVKDA